MLQLKDNSKKLILSLRDETPHFRGSDLWDFILEGHLSPSHQHLHSGGWLETSHRLPKAANKTYSLVLIRPTACGLGMGLQASHPGTLEG